MAGVSTGAVGLVEESGAAWVTLNRPDLANAMNPEMGEELRSTLELAAASSPLLVLTGAGKNFCGGFDLTDEDGRDSRFLRLAELLEFLRELPCVTVAAAHGHAVGFGADLVSHCDIRIAAPGADFRFPGFTKFGVVLGTRRLAELTGTATAIDAAARGTVFDAAGARAAGLVDQILPPESWSEWVGELATPLGRVPRGSVAALVAAVRQRDQAGFAGIACLASSLFPAPVHPPPAAQ